MAGIRPVLAALSTVAKRERGSFSSIASNNFFLFGAILLQRAGTFVFLLGALVILFPLSADPLRRIPKERLALWPLDKAERLRLRLLSPWVNPMTWLLAAFAVWAVWREESRSLVALCAALVAVGFFFPDLEGEPFFLRWLPAPPGAIYQLARKNLREMLLTLDVWVAALLSLSGLAYRVFTQDLPPEALTMITLLVVLAVSSLAQCLFGLESQGGRLRYRLMPLPGWKVLAAKNLAYLTVVGVLTAPLEPFAGLTAGCAALVVGHAPSLSMKEQTRWRFSTGAEFGNGLVQVFALTGAGGATARVSWLFFPLCAAALVASTWWFGRKLRELP